MKLELRNRWTAALRSGDFIQGKGSLRVTGDGDTPTRHCCLGVLGEIEYPDHWNGADDDDEDGTPDEFVSLNEDTDQGMLPLDTLVTVGLDVFDARTLAELNDSEQWSFVDIAGWIDANVEVSE